MHLPPTSEFRNTLTQEKAFKFFTLIWTLNPSQQNESALKFDMVLHSINSTSASQPDFFLPLQPMRPLKAAATSSQPVLTMQQIETIFYKIQDIFEIHKEFYDALLPSIQRWDEKVTVGHLFQKLVSLTLPQDVKLRGSFFLFFFLLFDVIHREQESGC